MTLKDMLNQVMAETGFKQQSQYFSSTKNEARQLTALANREVNVLANDDWEVLRKQHALVMTAATTYALPSDFRQFTPDTAWTNTRRVDFPTDASDWYYYTASGITAGLRIRMRLAAGQIEIQNPQPGQTVYIQYISNYPVIGDGYVFKQKFTADDDALLLNDDLFMLGVIWRFMKVKGLDWKQPYSEYRAMYRSEKGTDSGAQTIQTGEIDYAGPYPPMANLWL